MRDIPPYSLSEFRLLLSQYMDGVLEASQVLSVDALLHTYPEYQTEFLKLQATRAAIQNSLQNVTGLPLQEEAIPGLPHDILPETGALWNAIAGQLKAAAQAEPEDYEPEWLSAYTDGEVSRRSPEFLAFEQQLPLNTEANHRLAQFRQVSEAVKQFGYRQENQCAFEMSQSILAAFQAEQASTALPQTAPKEDSTETSAIPPEWALLSGFVDQALSPREMIQATQQIEASELTRARLLQLNQLSEGIQRVTQQLQDQAPDLWPQVRHRLEAFQTEQKTGQVHRLKRLHWTKRAAIPVAAAILLLALSLPNLQIPGVTPVNPAENDGTSPPAQQTLKANAATTLGKATQELASVPPSMMEGRRMRAFDVSESAPEPTPPLDPMLDKASSAGTSREPVPSSHLQPIFEAAPVMANANLNNGSSIPADAMAPHKTPSSDAYLFEALSKQMPEEEISNIIGK